MSHARNRMLRSILLAVSLAAGASAFALAQGRGGGGPGGGGMGGPPGGGPMGGGPMGEPFPNGRGPVGNTPPSGEGGGQSSGQARGGFQLGPPGQRWWDDKSVAKSLKLKPEQQARMDAIFAQNRGALLSHLEDLHQAEAHMDELAHASTLDESALFSQIDRVAQARAALEKANTHMLLQLRNEMDADQISRLEKRR